MKRKARQEISPQTREFRATNLEQRLKNALRFIATIFDEVSRPENKQELADALPDGKFLCQIAQFVCRRCQLSCFDFPKLARVTPNGKSRESAQNHAHFVSFCNEINIKRVPSLSDMVEKRLDIIVNVLLEIETFVQQSSSPLKIVHMDLDEYLTPSKKLSLQQRGVDGNSENDNHLLNLAGPSPLVQSAARDATRSSGLLKCLRPSFGGDAASPPARRMTSMKTNTPSYLLTAVEPSPTSLSVNLDTSMLATLNNIGQQMEQERTSQDGKDTTPIPSLQNPANVRHITKISSVRKRLLDQKDRDIASLQSMNTNIKTEKNRIEQEFNKEKDKTRALQKAHDKTRDEINLQARAFEENAAITDKLRTEVETLRKKLVKAEKKNEEHSIHIERLTNEQKDMAAKSMDMEAAAAEEAKRTTIAHIAETTQLQRTAQQLEEDLKASESSNERKDTLLSNLRKEVDERRQEMEASSSKLLEMSTAEEEMRLREAQAKKQHEEISQTLEETETKLDQAREECRTTTNQCEARLAVHENQARWFTQATSVLRTKLQSVSAAGRGVADEVRTQISSMSVDFASLSSQIVGSVKQLNDLREEAVQQYRREQRSRQKVFNELQRRRGNIRVLCRARPSSKLAGKERETGAYGTTTFNSEEEITVRNEAKKKRSANARCYQDFNFDHVFHPSSSQSDVYYEVSPMVQSAMDGFHSCIFAYGQTGSGKTYTMQGPQDDPGVYTRALHELFAVVDQREQTHKYTMQVSMVEIYNETIRDLLCDEKTAKNQAKTRGSGKGLDIKKGEHGNEVIGAEHLPVNCPDDIHYIMERGSKNRSTHGTKANEHSSRSHCLLLIYIEGVELQKNITMRGKLVMVDLAGSERISKTDASGARLKEAQHINKSLSALGNVINALKQKSNHVPFRDSKLTYLLQDSLSKDNKALMITQISPTEYDVEETMCTLQFASRVKGVELGAAKSHTKTSQTGKMLEMKKTITNMRVDINGLKKEVEAKTQELQQRSGSDDLVVEKENAIQKNMEKISTLEQQLLVKQGEESNAKRELYTMQKERNALETELESKTKQVDTLSTKYKTLTRDHTKVTAELEHEKERKERLLRRKGREDKGEQEARQSELVKLEARTNTLKDSLKKKEHLVHQLSEETQRLEKQLSERERQHRSEIKQRLTKERHRTEAAQREAENFRIRAEKSERQHQREALELKELKEMQQLSNKRSSKSGANNRRMSSKGEREREQFAERAAEASRKARRASLAASHLAESRLRIQQQEVMVEEVVLMERRVSYGKSPKALSIIVDDDDDEEEEEEEEENNQKNGKENGRDSMELSHEVSFMEDEDMELDSSNALDLSSIERRASTARSSRSSTQSSMDLDVSISAIASECNENEPPTAPQCTTPLGLQPPSSTSSTSKSAKNSATRRATTTTPRSSSRTGRTSRISSATRTRTPRHTPSKDKMRKAEKGILKKKEEMSRHEMLELYRKRKKSNGRNTITSISTKDGALAKGTLTAHDENDSGSRRIKSKKVHFGGLPTEESNSKSPTKSPIRNVGRAKRSRYRTQPSTPHNRIGKGGSKRITTTTTTSESGSKKKGGLLAKMKSLGGLKGPSRVTRNTKISSSSSSTSTKSTRSTRSKTSAGISGSAGASRPRGRGGWN